MKNRPTIMMVNRVYPPATGASGRLMHDLARHFVRTGHRVTLVTTDPDGASRKSRGPITITRIKGDSKPGLIGYAKALFRLYRAMQREPRHDVVITLSDPPLLYGAGARIARQKGAKHIHWCHDLYPDLFAPLGFDIPAFIRRYVYPRADAALKSSARVVAISTCMQRQLVKNGLDIRQISVIENWPDLELTGDAESPRSPSKQGVTPWR